MNGSSTYLQGVLSKQMSPSSTDTVHGGLDKMVNYGCRRPVRRCRHLVRCTQEPCMTKLHPYCTRKVQSIQDHHVCTTTKQIAMKSQQQQSSDNSRLLQTCLALSLQFLNFIDKESLETLRKEPKLPYPLLVAFTNIFHRLTWSLQETKFCKEAKLYLERWQKQITRDNSLELLQPMTVNPISFEFSRVLRYVTSKGIRQTVLDSTYQRNAGKFKRNRIGGHGL